MTTWGDRLGSRYFGALAMAMAAFACSNTGTGGSDGTTTDGALADAAVDDRPLDVAIDARPCIDVVCSDGASGGPDGSATDDTAHAEAGPLVDASTGLFMEAGTSTGVDANTSAFPDATGSAGASIPNDANALADTSAASAQDAGAVAEGGPGVDAGQSVLCLGCAADEKLCALAPNATASDCVSATSVFFGCAASSCAPCAALPHAQVACTDAGVCGVGTCQPGWADCNGDPVDGCEADLTSPATCTGCRTACDGATPLCGATGCTAACAGSDVLCTDRCVDVSTSAANCQDCGTACAAVTGGFPACSAGQCVTACLPGLTACGSGASAYCADLHGDWQNCGECGNACPQANRATNYELTYEAFQTCVSGQCTGGCQHGWTACEDVCVTTETDPSNCGACRNVCAPGDLCVDGQCADPSSAWIVVGLASPTEVAVDDTSVYWLDPGAGTVGVASKQGGPITLLAQNQVTPAKLFLDATTIYWAVSSGTTSAVMRAPKDGSAAPSIAVLPGDVGAPFIGIDQSYIYTGNTSTITKTPKAGSASVDIAVPLSLYLGDLVGVDDSGLYGYSGALRDFVQLDTTTGLPLSFPGAPDTPGSAFVSGGSLCFAEDYPSFVGKQTSVLCYPEEPGALGDVVDTFLYPGYAPGPSGPVAHQGPGAGWITRNRCGAFWSAEGRLGMAVAGTPNAAWLDPLGTAGGVAVDDVFIYWADQRGAIGKLPIP